MRLILYILIVFFCSTVPAFSAITFTDGQWGTTFDCENQVLGVDGDLVCDGAETYLDGAASDGSHSSVNTSYNNPSGLGGGGYSQIAGYGLDGINDASENIYANLGATPIKQIWVRFYIKYPTNWQANFNWDKYIYLQTYGSAMQLILSPNSLGFRFACQGGGSTTCEDTQTTYKVSDMFGGAYIGDNIWHLIEIHAIMDTDGTNGVAQAWIDGVLKIDSTTMNLSKGDTNARQGFTQVVPALNYAYIINVNDTFARIQIDDWVIHNGDVGTPSGWCDDGIGGTTYPCIGPIATATGQTTISNSGTGPTFGSTGTAVTISAE